MGNIVAIVGRPNVGKSTFFNRLTESKEAIVDEISGVTRDRHYGQSDWNGREFSVIDTGGYVTNSEDVFEEEIRKQVMLAMDEAHAILFVVDVESGITDLDESVAGMLRKIDKPVLLIVNKVDNNQRLYDANEFYKLGLGEIFTENIAEIKIDQDVGTGSSVGTEIQGFHARHPGVMIRRGRRIADHGDLLEFHPGVNDQGVDRAGAIQDAVMLFGAAAGREGQ